jgi:hypothetical protein
MSHTSNRECAGSLEQAFVFFWGDAAPSLTRLVLEVAADLLKEKGAKVDKVVVSEHGAGRSKSIRQQSVQSAIDWLAEREAKSLGASLFLMGASGRSSEEEGAKRAYVVATSIPPWVENRFGYTGGIVLPCSWMTADWLDLCARRGAQEAGSAYMFATIRPYLWAPASFVGGSTVIPFPEWPAPSEDDQFRTNEWRIQMQEGYRFRDGWLRDVFSLNWLNEIQLSMPVYGQPLRDWIAATPDRGALIPVSWNGYSKWEVPVENVDNIRRDLDPTGLLLAGRRSSAGIRFPQ